MIGNGLVPITLYVSPELKDKLRAQATQDGVSVAELIRALLEIALAETT